MTEKLNRSSKSRQSSRTKIPKKTVSPPQELVRLVKISPCEPEDFAALRELHAISIRTNGWRYYSVSEVEQRLMEIESSEYSIALAHENVLLARIGGTLVGTASWRPSQKFPQTAIITQIYLHPFFTRGGIATALIDEIEKAAYKQGFRFVSAQSDLNSRQLFLDLGYEAEQFETSRDTSKPGYPYQVMTRKIAANGTIAPHPGLTGAR